MEIDGIHTGRSRKGNWWARLADGRCITVFRRHDGGYGWCIADGKGEPRFSRCTYDSEAEAMDAAAGWLAHWASREEEDEGQALLFGSGFRTPPSGGRQCPTTTSV
jgi:hypothetical protein